MSRPPSEDSKQCVSVDLPSGNLPLQQEPTRNSSGASGASSADATPAASSRTTTSLRMMRSSVNRAEHEADHGELDGVVAAVDQPQFRVAALEQVIDAEARRHPEQAGGETRANREAQRGLRPQEHREHVRRHQREHEPAAENQRRTAFRELLIAEP